MENVGELTEINCPRVWCLRLPFPGNALEQRRRLWRSLPPTKKGCFWTFKYVHLLQKMSVYPYQGNPKQCISIAALHLKSALYSHVRPYMSRHRSVIFSDAD